MMIANMPLLSLSIYLVKPRRSFSTNGQINWEERNTYFYLDPAPMNEKVLIPAVHAGQFIVLHGPHAAGKTTRVERLRVQMADTFGSLK